MPDQGFYPPVGESDRAAAMAIYSLPGIGPVRVRAVLRQTGSFASAWSAGPAILGSLGLSASQRAAAAAKWATLAPASLPGRLSSISVRAVFYGDRQYPLALAAMPDPPLVVYIRGELQAPVGAGCALVGTRRASPYGRWMCGRIAAGVAKAGWPVVSGLAVGIDAAAHEAALSAGGLTWAVLAGGLDQVYPAHHRPLADRIVAQGGALFSEYLPGTPTVAGNFLARNRLISGLAAGVVIVEAGRRSGAISTARHALEQGREVLAVPGRCGDPGSAGPHALIRDGAGLVEDAGAVLAALARSSLARHPVSRPPPGPGGVGGSAMPAASSPVGTRLLEALASGPQREADLIQRLLPVGPGITRAALLELELNGQVERLDGAIYSCRAGASSPPAEVHPCRNR